MAEHDKTLFSRGRSARSNEAGRFERLQTEAFDDGWSPDEEVARIETTVTAQKVKNILSWNESPDIGFDRGINPYRGCERRRGSLVLRRTFDGGRARQPAGARN
jgi:hypothetical protein